MLRGIEVAVGQGWVFSESLIKRFGRGEGAG